MRQFRYEIDYRGVEDENLDLLNQRGSYGWELVSVVLVEDELSYFWKKTIEEII